jgi:hypothetical protein
MRWVSVGREAGFTVRFAEKQSAHGNFQTSGYTDGQLASIKLAPNRSRAKMKSWLTIAFQHAQPPQPFR